jgi:two-component system sensor histidine kinase/response regulator
MDRREHEVYLLDYRLGEHNGLELLREALRRGIRAPMIVLTGMGDHQVDIEAMRAGAADYLVKGQIDAPLLERSIRYAIEHARTLEALRKTHDDLEAILDLREDLSRMIMHDMGNFLTSIMLLIELLLKRSTIAPDTIAPTYVGEIEEIHTLVQRLNSFLNDMLIVAKMEAGKLVLTRSAVDINQLVQALERNHSVIAQTRGINLVIDLPEESRPVQLDANLFQRVLDNLIANALKFSPAESSVTVHVEYPEAKTASQLQELRVRIQVLDEGPGIAEDHRDRIFDKFEIVALKREGVSQFGLGLAFCKMVVEAHGGQIFVDANEPRGAVFTVEI